MAPGANDFGALFRRKYLSYFTINFYSLFLLGYLGAVDFDLPVGVAVRSLMAFNRV